MKAKELIKILEKNPEWNVKIVDRMFGMCEIKNINKKDDYENEDTFTNHLPSGDYFIIETKL